MKIQAVHENQVLKIPGVVGMGIGKAEDSSQLVFKVFVKKLTPRVERAIPKNLGGVPVGIEETGLLIAR